MDKRIDDLKEKNEAKGKITQELIVRFEKGATISAKLDTNLSKSFSREESGSAAGAEENSAVPGASGSTSTTAAASTSKTILKNKESA